jgi:Uma2 family endonuclease
MTLTDRQMQALELVHHKARVTLDLTPLQGSWTLEQYLRLTDSTSLLVEFTDGAIEVLPMPTDMHQVILLLLYELLRAFPPLQAGKILVAPLRLAIRESKQREPDLLLVLDANDPRRQNRYWLGADLVAEVVSEDDPERDTVDKVVDYAEANIPEYWIVNPIDQTITVLVLTDDAYQTHGVFERGSQATSVLLAGFQVSVTEVMDAR